MKHINLFNLNSEYELYKNSSEYVTPEVSFIEETNTVFYVPKQELYEWVDLGLPSGILWSAWNVGAENPEDFGLYFAWGETEGYSDEDVISGKKAFSWEDYKFGPRTNLTKYNYTDNLTQLELVDDVAHKSNNTCRMPTNADFEELIDNTTSTWETLNGVSGKRYTSNNGNSIFIPASGYYVYDDGEATLALVGSYGYLWSSTLSSSLDTKAYRLVFQDSLIDGVTGASRNLGYAIRPVKSK